MAFRSRSKRFGRCIAIRAMVRLRKAARLMGECRVLVRQRSSPKVTSRRQCEVFSMPQWPQWPQWLRWISASRVAFACLSYIFTHIGGK